MDGNGRVGQFFSRLGDTISDQAWYQQLKTKWDELDQQSRTYIRGALSIGGTLLLLVVVVISMWNVHKLKKELSERSELLSMLQSANEEMRHLKDSMPASGQSGMARSADQGTPWPVYFEAAAASQGIDKAELTVSAERTGAPSEQAKEALFDLSLKHVNIKQVVRFAFNIENGTRPVKLRNLSIDTKSDPSGYMDATLSVSAFTLKPQGS